jgi:CRISPR/Cas system-associated exonuclease Cas4 (RecB family)
MPMRKNIRASEIGAFLYCRRAWWYHRQGIPSENQEELAGGSELHRRHGRAVFIAGLYRVLAALLLLAALVLLTIFLAGKFL